jgi:hypothetical protein
VQVRRTQGKPKGYCANVRDLHALVSPNSEALTARRFATTATAARELDEPHHTDVLIESMDVVTVREAMSIMPAPVGDRLLDIIAHADPGIAQQIRDSRESYTLEDLCELLNPDVSDTVVTILKWYDPITLFTYSGRCRVPAFLDAIPGIELSKDPCITPSLIDETIWILRIEMTYRGRTFMLELFRTSAYRLYYAHPLRNNAWIMIDQHAGSRKNDRVHAILNAVADDYERATAV